MTGIVAAIAAVCILVVAPTSARGQSRDTTQCCTVVSINARQGTVTARETATGYTFRVEVRNRKHIAAVRVGHKVWANFAARKVRLEAAGDSLCCAIVGTAPPPDGPPPFTQHSHSRSSNHASVTHAHRVGHL